jgi:hypothetical protein
MVSPRTAIRENLCRSVGQPLGAHQRSDLLAGHNLADIPTMIEIKNDDRQIVILAK